MAKEATFQVRMDAELKAEVEALYKDLGTSFAEAVRIFARQSVRERGIPFAVRENVGTYEASPSYPGVSKLPMKGSAYGSLAKYADPAKIPFEDGAFEEAMVEKHRRSANGMLSKYADPSKIPFEDGAFEKAMVEKHAKAD